MQLSAVSAQLSDDHLQLARVIGQVAERLGEPKIGEWLSPYLLACMSRHETLSGMLSAIVDEQP